MEREFESIYAKYVEEIRELKNKLEQHEKSIVNLNELTNSQQELL